MGPIFQLTEDFNMINKRYITGIPKLYRIICWSAMRWIIKIGHCDRGPGHPLVLITFIAMSDLKLS